MDSSIGRLDEFFESHLEDQTFSLLKQRDFARFLSKKATSDSRYFFRLRANGVNFGKSFLFETAEARDTEYERLIDWAEQDLQGQTQRRFNFG
ncbi:MAG: hypothetical protein R2684_14500 [Pyrinomonadaceae bacterium]